MSTTVRNARSGMSWDAYYAVAACACVIGGADGGLDASERQILVSCLSMLGGRQDKIKDDINNAISKARAQSSSALFSHAADLLSAAGVDACLVICSAVATKSSGIATKEGVAIQNLARALGIGFPNQRYWKLLGEGMTLGRSLSLSRRRPPSRDCRPRRSRRACARRTRKTEATRSRRPDLRAYHRRC